MHIFWLACVVRKMDDHFQRPLWHIFIILSILATILEYEDWCQLSQKKFEKFWWKLKEYKPYPSGGGWFGFPPVQLGLMTCSFYLFVSGFTSVHRGGTLQRYWNFQYSYKSKIYQISERWYGKPRTLFGQQHKLSRYVIWLIWKSSCQRVISESLGKNLGVIKDSFGSHRRILSDNRKLLGSHWRDIRNSFRGHQVVIWGDIGE